jgi:hypothetical protein
LLFVFFFNALEFMSCHSSDATCIIVALEVVTILVLGVLLPTGFRPAATSADLLEFMFLLI